jgi:aspartate/methionine/tyrosine aminotransferase
MLSRRIRKVSEALIDTFNRRARALEAKGVDVISLGQALPGFAPPAVALDAARKALDNPETHIYAPDAGDPELQKLIAAWIARHDGIRVDPDAQLIVTAGGNQAAILALQCCCDAGDRVLVPAPYFMNHQMAVALVDATPIEIPTDHRNGYVITARQLFGREREEDPSQPSGEGRPSAFAEATAPKSSSTNATADKKALNHAAPEGRPKGLRYAAPAAASGRTPVVIVTTPNNPTGAIVPRRELETIARECARRGVFLIIDRTYAGFEFEREPQPARLKPLPDNVVIVGSFSKVFAMTGWRVGYLAGSAPLIAQALKAQDTMIICAPTIGQMAVRAALKKHHGVPPAFMRELRKRRDYVQARVAEMPGWSAVAAAGGFFTFVRIAGCADSIRFAHELLDRAHVLVMPGRIFGQAGEGHIRISYGVADVPTLKKAFDRIQGSA